MKNWSGWRPTVMMMVFEDDGNSHKLDNQDWLQPEEGPGKQLVLMHRPWDSPYSSTL